MERRECGCVLCAVGIGPTTMASTAKYVWNVVVRKTGNLVYGAEERCKAILCYFRKGKGNSNMKKTTYEALPKWYVRDNLTALMRDGVKLRYALPNGVKTVATIIGTKVVDGKVKFATSSEPSRFAYLGGKGWEKVEEVEVSLDESIRNFLDGISADDETEAAFRDIIEDVKACRN